MEFGVPRRIRGWSWYPSRHSRARVSPGSDVGSLSRSTLVCGRAEATGTGEPKDASKARTLHMARGRTRGCVTQTIAHLRQSLDGSVQLLGFGGQSLAIDANSTVGGEHLRDLVESEPRQLAEGDQRQTLEHAGVEEPSQASAPRGGDESLLLIEPKRRGGYAGTPGHFRDVEMLHP